MSVIALHARYYDTTHRGRKIHIVRRSRFSYSLCGTWLRGQAWPADSPLPEDQLLCCSCRRLYKRGAR